jgi:hypothetical protein
MRTRWIVAGLAVVLVLLAGGAAAAVLLAGDRPTRWDRPTAWHQLVARHDDDGPSVQLALDAFATLVGPVPGGHRASADTLGTASATPAVRWMLARWDELDAAQRDTFEQAVYGEEAGQATGVSAGPGDGSVSLAALPSDRDPELEAEIRPEVEAIAEDFASRAGIAMPRVRVVVSTTPDEEHDTYADTEYRTSAAPESPRGERRSARCVITFYPPATEERAGSPQDQETFLVTVAHELYHCHQYLVQDEAGVDPVLDLPDWLVEGSAEWAGSWYATQVISGFVSGEGWWHDYFAWPAADPRSSLYRLSYDALGFFAHLENVLHGSVGDDVWSTVDAMLLAGSSGEAFSVAAEAGDEVFLRQWAMGTFLDPELGSEWVTTGPGLPALGPSEVDGYQLGTDRPVTVRVRPAPGIARARVDVASGIEVLRADIAGHGAFHWAGPELEERGRTEWFDASQPEVRWYCFIEQCSCPDGGPAVPGLFDMPPPSRISVALTGGTEQATVTLESHTVDELCTRPPEPEVDPVRNCDDVFEIVQRHAPNYDQRREETVAEEAVHCTIEYTVPPVLDDFGNYLELGVLDTMLIVFSTTAEPRPAVCPPEGYCVETETQHVAAREDIDVPAHDVVHTTVKTSHVLMSVSEEDFGPYTPTDKLVQIALDIEAGIPR